VFIARAGETKKIMDEDPGVKAGIFLYEAQACRFGIMESDPKAH
jgi:hypothetical protein